MSLDDELLAIGRLVKEAAECKRNALLLKGNLEAMSAALVKASGQINGVFQGQKYPDFSANVQALPTPDQIIATHAEYLRELERSKELSARITALGI